jgi:hypothetical protein
VGQFLRYGQQLTYKERPVRRIIAVEREPTDTTWIELCARYDVKLVWPEAFGDLA